MRYGCLPGWPDEDGVQRSRVLSEARGEGGEGKNKPPFAPGLSSIMHPAHTRFVNAKLDGTDRWAGERGKQARETMAASLVNMVAGVVYYIWRVSRLDCTHPPAPPT